MALKVDLEKAYDKLEWSFLRGMLIRANLPADMTDIIMSCVSTVSTSILVNGEALDPIYPSREIRQGEPLSLYLFIWDTRESLCDILWFASIPSLGKYLGFPIKHSGTTTHEFNFILDRVKQKLSGWKANMLPLAGRAVLIQASSAIIPSYVMQGTYLPRIILDGIDRVRNTTLLAKLNWRFHTEEDALWVQVLKRKYCNNRRLNTTCKGPIRSLVHGPLTREASQWKFKDVLTNEGWDWNQIPFELTPEIKLTIQAIPISLVDIRDIYKTSKRIRWKKPPIGWKKLNTDGSVIGYMEWAECGGVFRDEHGNWVTGFTRHVGVTNSFAAELWGLRDGLMLCCSLNIPCLIFEIDAKVVVDVFQNSDYVNHIISRILDDCRQLMTIFQQVQVKHSYRQAN
ncbi:hypothetical protein SO802_000813 [Lithocarpus litseifolius]|uniref:RNase H type-1 domain-containing protein n=1 Tax=Lithocarpus litseifolius TaxID=425828 RepID=A0AAW2DUB0_9ROSI